MSDVKYKEPDVFLRYLLDVTVHIPGCRTDYGFQRVYAANPEQQAPYLLD
jgi:hypothetical protein